MIRLHTIGENFHLGLLAVIMMVPFGSCTNKISFQTSAVVPAARGYITTKKDVNDNYNIKLHISNLAEVNRLVPVRKAYVVWMVTDTQRTDNIGQLNSGSSAFSKNLKAAFETVSSSRPTRIFITAEDDPGIQYPGSQVVLTTDNF